MPKVRRNRNVVRREGTLCRSVIGCHQEQRTAWTKPRLIFDTISAACQTAGEDASTVTPESPGKESPSPDITYAVLSPTDTLERAYRASHTRFNPPHQLLMIWARESSRSLLGRIARDRILYCESVPLPWRAETKGCRRTPLAQVKPKVGTANRREICGRPCWSRSPAENAFHKRICSC